MRFISATSLSSATLLTFGLRSLAYENQNRRQALSGRYLKGRRREYFYSSSAPT
jgi:hypothetical protein